MKNNRKLSSLAFSRRTITPEIQFRYPTKSHSIQTSSGNSVLRTSMQAATMSLSSRSRSLRAQPVRWVTKTNIFSTCKHKTSVRTYSTDRTQHNTKADPESGPEVRFGSAFQKFASALGPLGVRSESARGPLCALMREAYPALLLPLTSPAPCIFQIHCPASSLCSSDQKHTHVQDSQAISWTKSPGFRLIFCKKLFS